MILICSFIRTNRGNSDDNLIKSTMTLIGVMPTDTPEGNPMSRPSLIYHILFTYGYHYIFTGMLQKHSHYSLC